MSYNNQEVAELLREVATALVLKKANQFQVRAYETAADSIEHSTAAVYELWQEGKLDVISGVGEKLQAHLDELFRTGRVAHFESIKRHFPGAVYELISIPGVGPSTAEDLAKAKITSIKDLQKKLKTGYLAKHGFGDKTIAKLKLGVEEYLGLGDRMLLPIAGAMAEKIIQYMKTSVDVLQVEALGSLRRMMPTIGDLDFAVAARNHAHVVEHFVNMPDSKGVINQGDDKATIVLNNGKHVDLLVTDLESWGALLQHFTGSKEHNIRLREIAQKRRLSLSEYGVKDVKSQKVVSTPTEEVFYRLIGMSVPPPEIRENTGEIELAMKHKLPKLVEYGTIKGDFHLHSNFAIEPSHDAGRDSMEEIVDYALKLGYEYVGLSDHSPAISTHNEAQIQKIVSKRTSEIKKLKNTKSIRVLNGLEIDIMPDGTLSVPNNVLASLDYTVAGVHSVHKMPKEAMTKRTLKAIENPYVTIIAHPSGRLLNQRQSFEMDWEKVFRACVKNKTMLEINAYPSRLDLREDLVREAIKYGVILIINTDAHQIEQMDNMRYGVSVARRGWATAKSVANTWEWKKMQKWFRI